MLRNSPKSYGLVSILFHWAIAFLFLLQMPLGYLTQATRDQPALQFELYQWHKSVGFLILLVASLRLAWWLLNPKPQLPDTIEPQEKVAARAVHVMLYLLTILVPLAGWAVVSTSPLQIPSYAFNLVVVPNLPLAVSSYAEGLWSSIHGFLAYAAAFLAAVHILAALRHHFHFRDRILLRMLWPEKLNK
jgi:cytochrome b561